MKCSGCGGALESVVLVVDPKGLLLEPKPDAIRVRTEDRETVEAEAVFCLNRKPECLAAMAKQIQPKKLKKTGT